MSADVKAARLYHRCEAAAVLLEQHGDHSEASEVRALVRSHRAVRSAFATASAELRYRNGDARYRNGDTFGVVSLATLGTSPRAW